MDCSMPDSPCPSLCPKACSDSCPLSQWCSLVISSSATLFSFCFQSSPASGSFPVSFLFASGSQSIGASASAAVLRMNIQDWFPLGLTFLISLLSKGLSRIFSSTTIWKHQFFGAQPSLWSNSCIYTWLMEKLRPFTLSLSRPFPFCCWRNRSTERLSYLLRVTQEITASKVGLGSWDPKDQAQFT